MKILSGLVLVAFLFIISCSENETEQFYPIYEGDVRLRTQQQVDEFGLKKYIEIKGNLYIDSHHYINNLSELNTLKKIHESLIIVDNFNLSTLEGLNNIETIGLTLILINNSKIKDLNGLSSLLTLGEYEFDHYAKGTLILSNNDSLNNIDGLLNIDTLKNLEIKDNDLLIDLNALNGVNIGGGELLIEDNAHLNSLPNFNVFRTIDKLNISNNDSLKSLEGLIELESIAFDFKIDNNFSLTSLDGLNNLSYLGGANFYHSISNNPSLVDFCALEMLFKSGLIQDELRIELNKYNPSFQQITTEECKQ